MSANFIRVDSLDALDALFVRSNAEAVILFKHSVTCSISAGVYRQVRDVDADVHLVVIQTNRDISNRIAEKTGVRHESPQAIVLKDEKPVYYASHYDITAEDVTAHLS